MSTNKTIQGLQARSISHTVFDLLFIHSQIYRFIITQQEKNNMSDGREEREEQEQRRKWQERDNPNAPAPQDPYQPERPES